MEKRVLLAIVLCVGVLVGWNFVSAKIFPPAKAPTPAGAVPAAVPAPDGGNGEPVAVVPAQPVPPQPEPPGGDAPAAGDTPVQDPKVVEIAPATGRLVGKLASAGGGVIKSLDVWGCAHHEPGDRSVAGDPGLVTAYVAGREGFLAVDLLGVRASGIGTADWVFARDAAGEVFTGTIDRGGWRVTKTLRPSQDPAHPYHSDLEVSVENVAAKAGQQGVLEVVGPWMPVHPHSIIPEDGVIVAPVDESVKQLMAPDIAKSLSEDANHEQRSEKGFRFIGVRSDFYLAALLPTQPLPVATAVGFRAARVQMPAGVTPGAAPSVTDTAAATLRIPFESPAVGSKTTWKFMVFTGPDSRGVIGVEGSAYESLGDAFPNRKFVGLSFGPIARFLGWLLSILAISANLGWGLAVCGLTILVRGLLFPLSKKTQVSMKMHSLKMQKAKPRLDALKEKYADNPRKQQEETMKVFREEKLSILPGGCLLAFLQMPVWISLYGTLQTTFDMRHAKFLWAADLTAPDHLLEIPALRGVWGIGSFTQGWLNLLPFLMMITWFVSASMQPLPDDPEQRAQAKMMRWIPLLFGFFLYSTASGLTLYMTLSAMWSIGESWFIKRTWVSKMTLETLPVPKPVFPAKRR